MRFVLIPVLWIAAQAPAEEKARPYDSAALQRTAIALERPLEGAELTLDEALKRITREHRVTIVPSTFTPEERARRVEIDSGSSRGQALLDILRACGHTWGLRPDGSIRILASDAIPKTFEVAALKRTLNKYGTPIDVEFEGKDLEEALRFLSSVSGLSIDFRVEKPTGATLTLAGKGVPFGLLLSRSLHAHGLEPIVVADGSLAIIASRVGAPGMLDHAAIREQVRTLERDAGAVGGQTVKDVLASLRKTHGLRVNLGGLSAAQVAEPVEITAETVSGVLDEALAAAELGWVIAPDGRLLLLPYAEGLRALKRDAVLRTLGKTEKTLSMKAQNEKLRDVLNLFEQLAGITFVCEKTPLDSRKVNVQTDTFPLGRALHRTLLEQGLLLAFRPDGKIQILAEK